MEELADQTLLNDLVAKSFALIETVINLQEDLDIRLVQEDLRDVITVGDLVRVCSQRLAWTSLPPRDLLTYHGRSGLR